MRHYEIVFLVHPDQSDQSQSILEKFSSLVTDSGGGVHRLENIGSKKLAYPIKDQFKASYCLMNIECHTSVLEEIKNFFNFNDSIIRELILSREKPYKELSALSSQVDSEEEEDLFSDPKKFLKKESSDSSKLERKKINKKSLDELDKDKSEV